jgi:predicted nuclease with TOPRIM domain
MKKLLYLLTIAASLTTLSPLAEAKDKDKDRDKAAEYEKKLWKELRDDVRELRKEQDQLVAQVNLGGVSRRTQDDVGAIGMEVQRINAQFERGNYDYRNLRDRISRLNLSISRTRDQVNYERTHRPRYFR